MPLPVFTMKMPPEMKKALQKLADADRRTLSDFIRLQLEKVIQNSKKKSK